MHKLKSISVILSAQGIAVFIFAFIFAGPELLENKLYLLGALPFAAVSIFFGLSCYFYALKHDSVASARREFKTAEPLPKPPFSNTSLIFLLCVFGLLGLAGVGFALFK
ncbi:hypothetical protein LMG31884_47080 (plasmid) [Xanthomonas hydrangeae]|uniref:hypothetical protein n=1 Tax=Xanthomonas hydrangeae TaxID=2775159 RepID=UPI001962B835|nr:hypothetical protein LMG31884_47080 [Xanthomonas hydrangeae]CAD7740944.1 hypothetical protein LMG31884_47080 [Xanthomonas hydrangeae]CAD7748004.1 hypothetical protein LMG31887_46730 [Xanthomonas hydrangeae]CAD7748005.1 hypothetical protein LMG31887_46730 [Xanthomonas hydrangeae]CAD7748118.1 hypothetical protein LMG31885_44760 [Xanthomonas hydrangeae]